MPRMSADKKVSSSQEALVCGEAFQRQAEKLLSGIWKVEEGSYRAMPDEMGDAVVCATNLAFALELYLKALLTQLGLAVPPKHDLRLLYDSIPQSARTLIESTCDATLPDELRRLGGHVSFTLAKGSPEVPQWDDYKVSLALPNLLARSKDLFNAWRYVFEFSQPEDSTYQFHQFEYGPLRCAAEVLRVEVTVRLHKTGERALPNSPVID